MSRFVDLTLNGISSGMIYAAVAIAFVIIWRSTRVVNFAQGALFMVTTFIASSVIASSGSYWLGFGVANLVSSATRPELSLPWWPQRPGRAAVTISWYIIAGWLGAFIGVIALVWYYARR